MDVYIGARSKYAPGGKRRTSSRSLSRANVRCFSFFSLSVAVHARAHPEAHTSIHTHAHTHKHTQARTHAHTQTLTHIHTHTHTHTHTPHTHTQEHIDTDTDTNTQTHTQTQTQLQTQTRTLTLTQTQTHVVLSVSSLGSFFTNWSHTPPSFYFTPMMKKRRGEGRKERTMRSTAVGLEWRRVQRETCVCVCLFCDVP